MAWAIGSGLLWASGAQAGVTSDRHGNVGYDTAAECDAAVADGTARFYEPFTSHPPLPRAGEVDVKVMKLSDLTAATLKAQQLGYDAANYARGACDLGVGRSQGRDGASRELIGKYVPFAPTMSVNVYFDSQGTMVRATMQKCDNNFSGALPRPVGAPAPVGVVPQTDCYANVQIPAQFETRTEQVLKVPVTTRQEVVPATYKTITEQELVTPEIRRQIPVPATYKTITEVVEVSPASFREEPVPPTFKMVEEEVVLTPASSRIEIVPATYKTETEQILISPERKELRVIPARYEDKSERVVERPASKRLEVVPATYKTETEQVLVKAESVRYEPIVLPMRIVTEQMVREAASQRLEAQAPQLRTVTERVLVKAASKRLVEVPAEFETVTERVKVSEATREWKRGRAWVGQALDVRPLRGFAVGTDGTVDGVRVEAAARPGSLATVYTGDTAANNRDLDDDVMCLVEVPAQYETLTRQVLRRPASVREEIIPAEYTTITRQVLDKEASVQEIALPATFQSVARQEVDVEKLRTLGYRFDDSGRLVATPSGERVLRASEINAAAGAQAAAADAGQLGDHAYVREIKIPAQYRTVTREVVATPATVREIEVPATYRTVTQRVVSEPARTEEVVIPAVYETVTRQVVDQPATQREIPIPAVMGKVQRRVVDRPATTRQIPVPAVTKTEERQVLDTPATFREEIVPAVYKTVERRVVDQPASTRDVEVPAQYETLSYQFKVQDARTERRAVLCETNATPAKIREIQRALRKAGFNPGPVNGVLRAATMRAVNQYQRANNLPVDGFLNLETVKALNVSPY